MTAFKAGQKVRRTQDQTLSFSSFVHKGGEYVIKKVVQSGSALVLEGCPFSSSGYPFTWSADKFELIEEYAGIDLAATSAPINDTICAACGNDKCSHTEKSCWRCGAALQKGAATP